MKNVAVRGCEDYSYENVKKAINKSLKDIGGLDNHIQRFSKVLIKPNLLMKKRPEDATTTHPMILKVVCEELLKLECDIIIAESPGGPYTESALRGIYKTCGIEAIASELGVKLNYDLGEVRVENKEAKALRYMDIIKPITEVDHVINLCKLKTHVMANFTGGTKNLYGCIAGLKKAEIHYRFPTEELFCEQVLLDICSYINPTLTIMDAVVGMEGDGPSAGNPRKIGAVLASTSPYAIDVVACNIINLEPTSVLTITGAIKRKFISSDFTDIHTIGEDINKFMIKDYKLPNKGNNFNLLEGVFPEFINKHITKMLTPKPIVSKKICIKCGYCVKVCPAKVINMNGYPIINIDNCIRCYCCHELCPKKAIHIK
ncbi:MAG: DUF362 domain-containing protein, partial [Paraclostridium sp.]